MNRPGQRWPTLAIGPTPDSTGSMQTKRVSTVVLGAGAIGSSTAYHLARRGEPVTLVERFSIGHDRGSSHGASRIARHSYADPAYARLMVDAFQAWRELEADAGVPLFVRTGGLSICPESQDYADRVARSLESVAIPHRLMSGRDLNRAIPTFRVGESDHVVFEPDAGLIAARRAIEAQVGLARRLGGDRTEIIENARVHEIDLDGPRPRLLLDDMTIEPDRMIVAAGPWTGRLLPTWDPVLRPTRQQVLYFRPLDRDAFAVGRFPAFIFIGESPDEAYYGMPEAIGMGVKVARHGGPDVDPEDVDRSLSDG